MENMKQAQLKKNIYTLPIYELSMKGDIIRKLKCKKNEKH